jgi:hypothetical protein
MAIGQYVAKAEAAQAEAAQAASDPVTPAETPPVATAPASPPPVRRRHRKKTRTTKAHQAFDKWTSDTPDADLPSPEADAFAEELIAEMETEPPVLDTETPIPPPPAGGFSLDDVLKIIAATKTTPGGGFDEAALTRVLASVTQTNATANAQAMQTALNRSNPNYIPRSPYHRADGSEAIPQYTVYFGPQFTSGRGAPLPRDLYSPDECDLINRFEPGPMRSARGGQWTAEVLQNGSTKELVIKAPMATMDQRSNLPSFTLILRELLDGEVAVNPETLAARVAELERKLAAAQAAA